MFLATLTEPQKEAFLSLATMFIASDGLLQVDEVEMLNMMKYEMGLSTVNQPDEQSLDNLYSCFDTRKSKTVAVLEMIGLGYADNDYNSSESKFICEMANAIGFSSEDIIVYENWVQRMMALTNEALSLMKED